MEEEQQHPGSDAFSVRIVSIDHYMASPIPGVDICYSSFQGGKVNEVPVIRIYGSTPAGQKTCLHVHRALPYLYIPCADLLLQLDQGGESCTQLISMSLEKALKLKGNAGSKRQHVHSCNLVRAKRLYGYYSTEEVFAKIYLYHPQDVARAANFLLGGAVLDRSLQPHESHIPFLLQFLVDYNLYGMGHLHVSRMKFRQPVPDVFAQKRSSYFGPKPETDIPARMSEGFQADSSCSSPVSSPIWISSTIPSGWMWDFSSQLDSSSCQDFCHVKRQSTCELEGDATVDEILNQQLKTYSSLSQTRTDVKMVQSLIPIWEEEFARTGIHEHALLSVPGKPLPADVLRILSFGLELENNLMELFNVVDSDSCWTPGKDVRHLEQLSYSSNENYNLEDLKVDTDAGGASKCSKGGDAKAISLQLGGSCGIDNVESPIRGAIHPGELIGNDRQTDETNGSTDVKVVDNEALGLLSWLASSQAAEDMNSDDELARETVLTPLLPSTSIDKVLAKASRDFESESQQECQDILDSVENSGNFDNFKEGASSSDHYPNKSTSIIPQLDGSADDQDSNPNDGSHMVNSNETQRFPRDEVQQDTRGTFFSKNNSNQPLWGSLPISSTKKVECDLDLHGRNCSKVTDSKVTCVETKNQDPRDVVSKKESTIVGCSVRDLMRRKRCHQIDPSDPESRRVKKVSSEWKQHDPKQIDSHGIQIDGQNMRTTALANSTASSIEVVTGGHDVSMLTEALNQHGEACDIRPTYPHSHGVFSPSSSSPDEHIAQESASICFSDLVDKRPSKSTNNSSTLASYPKEDGMRVSGDSKSMRPLSSELFTRDPRICVPTKTADPGKELLNENLQRVSCLSACIDDCVCQRDPETNICSQQVPHISSQSVPRTETLPGSTMLQFEASVPVSLVSHTIDSGAPPLGLIGMTFHIKPPLPGETVGTEISSSFIHTDAGGESYEGISVNRRLENELLPFFAGDRLKDEQSPKTSAESDSDYGPHIMGIPTHYQNDGSYSYMLTPLCSPPSADVVSRWLFLEDLGKASKAAIIGPPFQEGKGSKAGIGSPPSPEGMYGSQMYSQDPENDDCRKHSPEFGLVSGGEPILDQLKPQSLGDVNDETNNFEGTKMYQGECSITKEKEIFDNSNDISQISGPDGKSKPTPLSQIGFRDPASFGAGQQLTLLSIEVQAASRGDLRPDPRFDAVNVVVLAFQEDSKSETDICVLLRTDAASDKRYLDGVSSLKVLCFSEEKKLISHIINIIGSSDPDVLMGWDIQGCSLGFLAERSIFLGIGLLNSISRTPTENKVNTSVSGIPDSEALDNLIPGPLNPDSVHIEDAIIDDEWGRTHASGVHVGGRIVLNIWRLMRGEVKLNMYTIEAVAEAVLRRKVPYVQSKILNRWFTSGPARARFRCIEYVVERAKMNFEIMNQLDMINRTSELARVFGIEFFSVLSRGSQYRVESMLLRLAHTQNYVAISPASQQVASQPAMECLPLVMEPESGFYADPVVVLDFQSLYPSMIIAYNLCFCTCLGNAIPSKANTLGVSSFSQDLHQLQTLKDDILLTPNGIMYVSSKVRQGILPRLLEEILSTRIMVKQAMKKLTPSEQVLHRIFNARQLALKLIANVTYGYTAAGFSGRMPCAELADSIVQCGRRTLEHAISTVNAHDKWNARVIYGDTDSLFVLLKGRSRKEAFEIGREIASEITAANPNPVTLKMEKVYHPCFLLTKKRYVGYSYENPDQEKPVFDAKGIETIRRDTCPAVAKTLEQSLRLFFASKDIEKVKEYLLRQWSRILSGRVSLQDFIFAKEVRLGTYSARNSSSLPPAAIVATKAMRRDPRAEPRYGERVPYVVVHGEPGSRLVDMVVEPLDLLEIGSPFRLNDVYYISKQIIPALQRVFGLVGADLNRWFSDMPRPARELIAKRQSFGPNSHRTRIDYYYLSKHCSLCGELVQGSAHFCDKCSKNEAALTIAVVGRTSKLEKEMHHLAAICRQCGGGDWLVESGVKCTSLACSVFFERRKVQKEFQAVSTVATDAGLYPKCMVEWF